MEALTIERTFRGARKEGATVSSILSWFIWRVVFPIVSVIDQVIVGRTGKATHLGWASVDESARTYRAEKPFVVTSGTTKATA